MLGLVPRGTDRALDAPPGEMIDRDDLGGQHRGMPVGHPRDERAEPHARRLSGEPGKQGPAFERRLFRVAVERLEVVEDPDAVEAYVLGEPSPRDDLIPRQLVLRDVQTECHVRGDRAERRFRAMAKGAQVQPQRMRLHS